LILSDLQMPDDDGFHFLATAQADSKLRRIPFVLISSSGWGTLDQERASALGAACFLLRPVEPRRLLKEIKSCLAMSPE
jgi:CheY-like chemotaxis protein